MNELTQMKKDFPNMYLRVMRNDALVAIKPTPVLETGLSVEELVSSEDPLDELVVLEEPTLPAKKPPKKTREPRRKKNDPDNFPM